MQSCSSVATSEVHLEVMQEGIPNLGPYTVEPSLKFLTGGTLVPSAAQISMSCLQHRLDQLFGGSDENILGKTTSAPVPMEVSTPSFIGIPSLCAEKTERVHAAADNETNGIGEPEGAFPFYNSRVEDSDDLEKASLLPTTAAVGTTVIGVDEDLNFIYKGPSSPFHNCNTHAVENTGRSNVISDQAAVRHDSPNAGYCEEIPSCGPNANASAEIQNNKAIQVLFQSPTHTKAEPILHDRMHRTIQSSCQPSLDAKVKPAVLPLEATSYDCVKNSIENKYLIDREQQRNDVGVNFSKKEQDRKIVKQRDKGKKNNVLPAGVKDQLAERAQKGNAEPKPLPIFKNFVVEEEEGSGGYGIVYRARRKTDGSIVAIKCPHSNAHSHHVDNERKMLERFGGKHFVIRYETSLRSGDLDCFVLEHVVHDRPEILKKEISVFEMKWYGYCLFSALSSLHKQGVVHRDVKPGNFLFSRRLAKGYLIDFNLANDIHQKYLRNSKSETISCGKDTTSQSALKSALVIHAKEVAADPKQALGSKRKRSNKSPVGGDPRIGNKSKHGGQAADISGVTSAKDPTSTKTQLDRLKQPMPYKGRKELMNFLHEAMHSPKQKTLEAPVSQRKRVAAPVSSGDRKLFVLTPMPLRSGGSAVAGTGMFNSKGQGKQRREGPCVGTKGFRAPEVLLRSFYQGCKVDVWSAGVTLLYLIIGKSPFGGDPEQNMKEIAKLRGSEGLWEVAKLHNCESSYPSELCDAKWLQSVDLREWCVANARRPEFLEYLPDSLFDLVDKCLAVNPRCRITSDEALSHEFFASCHESLRKKKALRIGRSGAGASHPPPSLSQDNMVKVNESQRLFPTIFDLI